MARASTTLAESHPPLEKSKVRVGIPITAPIVLLVTVLSIAWFAVRPIFDSAFYLPLGLASLVVPALLACWLAIGVSRRKDLTRRDINGWAFVALCCGMAAVSSTVVLLPDGAAASGATPMIGAIAHSLMLVFGTIGVLHWVRRLSPSASIGTSLDLLCIAVVAYMVTWRTLFSSALLGTADTEGLIDQIALLTTPALGTLLLVAVVIVLSQVGRENIRGTELLATFGLGAIVATELGMSMKGVSSGGLDDAWRDTMLASNSLPMVALGWVLGTAAIGFGASLRRTAPAHGAHLPLVERSTTWELMVSLIPFTLLGIVLATTTSVRGGSGLTSAGILALLGGILLVRCTLVAVNAIRSARTSETDHLTHALSHRMFQERFPIEFENARAAKESIALIVFDVDDFGLLNETYSHAEGDRFLQEVSWAIRQQLQGGELLFRNGGDEFAIAVPCSNKQSASELAEQISTAVGKLRSRASIRPTLTIGIASAPEDATTAHELVQIANGTLYWGKLNGKASITAYDSEVVKVLSADERLEVMERTARLRAVFALARALDARDAYTARHSENVSKYSVAIARQMDWPLEKIELLRVAGLLHDVGKIGVRDSTLRKSSKLSEAEWKEMQQHPVLGARMVAGVAPEEIIPWIVSHHERIDGRGYPHNLVGDAIPDGARVLAVADTFDAMTSSRSYRPALSPLHALSELVSGAGTQFDLDCVQGFIQAARSGAIDLEQVAQAARTAPAQEQHEPSINSLKVDPEFDTIDPATTGDDVEDGFSRAA